MLEKIMEYDHSITADGNIQVKKITKIMENDEELSRLYHRHVVSPGDDYTFEDARTKIIAEVIHTPQVIQKYKKEKKI